MPSIRSILQGGKPASDSAAQQQGLEGEALDAPGGGHATTEPAPQVSEAELIADRLRFAASQRAAFAEGEINRLQVHIEQLQDRMAELTKQNQPTGALRADLDHAEQLLDEAKADLARAHESRQNTDLAASLGQGRQEAPAHRQHTGQGTGTAGKLTVGDTIGKHAAPTGIARGPRKKL